MLKWQTLIIGCTTILLGAGCEVVTSERYQKLTELKNAAETENVELHAKVAGQLERMKDMMKLEDAIVSLESVLEPLAPLSEKNQALMKTNNQQKEEAGGGALGEIFYLIQSAYAELDKSAATIAADVMNKFNESDYGRPYLLKQLQDKVNSITLEVAELALRHSSHIANDRRLVVARLKSLNECFLALRNLAQSKAFDLTYSQRLLLLEKTDQIRLEYGKVLKTNIFPAIPQLVSMASGEDYLKTYDTINNYITDSSIFYKNTQNSTSVGLHNDLTKELNAMKKKLSAQ